jgi:hypothetical protein
MLKRLANFKNKEFIVLKTVSFEEQADIEVMFRVINEFEAQNLKYEIVREIYQDVLETLNSGRRSHLLFRQLMELMSTFNAFLNHWTTYLKREFGETSKNYQDFKKCTSEQFDGYVEYRFLYGLRNYIHHCGMPNIIVNSSLDQKDNPVHQFTIKKAELLAGMDWHKLVRSDFEFMPDSFDIFSYFKVLLECLARIHTIALNNIDMVKVILCAQRMITYKQYRDAKDTELVLLGYNEFDSSGAPKVMDYEVFKFNLADYLLKQIRNN